MGLLVITAIAIQTVAEGIATAALLPVSFALAGGAMLALVVVDLLPDAWQHDAHGRVALGSALGAAVMLALGLALEV